LDAHQGNGHERDHIGDDDTFIIDAYNHDIYPNDNYAKQAIKYDIKVSASTRDEKFLNDVEKAMMMAVKSF